MFNTKAHKRRRVPARVTGPGLTEQQHKDEVKVSNILAKYRKTGVMPHVHQYKGTYANFIGHPDFEEAQRAVAAANSMFETLPARVRANFNNNAGEFVHFMNQQDNREAIVEMGLDVSHLPEPPPTPAPAPAPAPTPGAGATTEAGATAPDPAPDPEPTG